MKAYVHSNGLEPAKHFSRKPPELQYTRSPSWTMPQSAARDICAWLNAVQLHSAHHACLFDIEEVTPKAFAVCCIYHPGAEASDSPDTGALRTRRPRPSSSDLEDFPGA